MAFGVGAPARLLLRLRAQTDRLGEPRRVEVHDGAHVRLQHGALALEVVQRVVQRLLGRGAGELVLGECGVLREGGVPQRHHLRAWGVVALDLRITLLLLRHFLFLDENRLSLFQVSKSFAKLIDRELGLPLHHAV